MEKIIKEKANKDKKIQKEDASDTRDPIAWKRWSKKENKKGYPKISIFSVKKGKCSKISQRL